MTSPTEHPDDTRIGQTVHYRSHGTPDNRYRPDCRAAIITQLPCLGARRDYYGLAVFNPSGIYLVPELPYDATADIGGSWHLDEQCPFRPSRPIAAPHPSGETRDFPNRLRAIAELVERPLIGQHAYAALLMDLADAVRDELKLATHTDPVPRSPNVAHLFDLIEQTSDWDAVPTDRLWPLLKELGEAIDAVHAEAQETHG